MKKMTLFTFLALSMAVGAHSYYPEEIVEQWQSGHLAGKALRDSLNDILAQYHRPTDGGSDEIMEYCSESKCYKQFSLGYKGARKVIMGNIHLKKDENNKYYLEDVYCQKRFTSGVGPNKIPNSNVVNVEHTWPQSRFGGALQSWQKADLHHLFPSDSRANSSRGNLEFAEVEGDKHPYSGCTASTVGYAEGVSSSTRYFQAPLEHQGNIARAIFYFAVRYKLYVDSTEEFYLRLWHELDPVDEEEMARNDAILEHQGNRNPFIDYPELVDLIDNF